MDTYSNKKKRKQLGMAIGTATHRLRMMYMLSLATRLGENICYRCGKIIDDYTDMSLDHKEPWLDSSINLFWDIENIALAHKGCNYSSVRDDLRRKAGKMGNRVVIEKYKIICPEGTSWCARCKDFRLVEEFHKNKRRENGLERMCKKHKAEHNRAMYIVRKTKKESEKHEN